MRKIITPWLHSIEKKFHHYSMKTVITFFVLIFILPLIVLQIATSIFALSVYQQKTVQTIEQMASYFLSEIDDSLNGIEHYLAKTASENYDFGRIAYDDPYTYPDSEYELFRIRFFLSMRQNIDFYPNSQYFFFYQEDRDDLLLISSSEYMPNTAPLSYSSMSAYLSEYFSKTPDAQKEWELTDINGQTELLRIFRFGNSYLGASVPISALLEKLEKYNLNNCEFHISDAGDAESGKNAFTLFSNSLVHLDSSEGNYAISLTISHKEFFTPALIVFLSLLLLSVLMLCLIPLSRHFLRGQFYTPLRILIQHMKKIEYGQTDETLPSELGGPEMTQAARSFNQMMEQIQNLKIQVYEEKLAQSRLELQCLHLQLNPHFFLNTLNSAYLLVKSGDLENLQLLLKSLTGYFRSVFQSSSESVSLSLELRQCQNYICIYQIRCFKKIQINFEIEEELMEEHIPSMCILTFIENSIKYAVEELDKLYIVVSVSKITEHDSAYMEIIVKDNGIGFTDHALAGLNQKFTACPLTGSHIGIRNLKHRLHYLYKGKAFLIFDNDIPHGAKVTILLPL